jgi:hypothetical protein
METKDWTLPHLQETHVKYKDTQGKHKRMEKVYHANTNRGELELSHGHQTRHFRAKNVPEMKSQFTATKESIHQKGIKFSIFL